VFLITAAPEVRAARLAARGRESADDVAGRLAREGAGMPAGIMPLVIGNSGALKDGVRRFLKALGDVAG
jgi:ribose 1,5-bisphosphokinase PhnN